MTNLQGDVMAITDTAGAVKVQYEYDAWGKILSVTGSMANTLGQQNPMRYRGYYYDTETSSYYLQSRYYLPNWKRFINADGAQILSKENTALNSNLFGYCGNSPIINLDTNGAFYTLNKIVRFVSGDSFWYDSFQGIFSTTVDALQRKAGYCDLIDILEIQLGMDIMWKTMYFNYGAKEYRIELWKGFYGLFTGAEIGIYIGIGLKKFKYHNKSGKYYLYRCANNSEMLFMNMVIKNKKVAKLFLAKVLILQKQESVGG